MAKGEIHAGVCGMSMLVEATNNNGELQLHIETNCPHYKDLESKLQGLEPYGICFGKVGQTQVYTACATTCPHGACPVPMGIVKTIEVAAGLALPADVTVTLSKS